MKKEKKQRRIINFSKVIKFTRKIMVEIIIFLIGILMFTINVGWVIHSFTYVETEATIYKVRYDWRLKSYRPIYEYKHKNGKRYRVLGNIVGAKKDFTVGDKVSIIYNPKNYKKIDEGSKKDSIFVWITCILGLIISLISLYLGIKKIKKLKAGDMELSDNSDEKEKEEKE